MAIDMSLALLITLILCAITVAHQSIGYPRSISYNRACRVGNGEYCPGPCPRRFLRRDVTPDNPTVTVRRGRVLAVKTLKNNHVGGFVRWSLVKVKDMYSHRKHRRNAFFYSCADQSPSKCNRRNKRDLCPGDYRNEYYQHYLRIPPVYKDGVYVLGFAWYGGLTRQQKYGFFGDYYDCTYIRIRGGPLKGSHKVEFRAGKSLTGRGGMCKATVNKLGYCRREPCTGNGPRQYRIATYMKPAEFNKKRRPKRIKRNRSRGRKYKRRF